MKANKALHPDNLLIAHLNAVSRVGKRLYRLPTRMALFEDEWWATKNAVRCGN